MVGHRDRALGRIDLGLCGQLDRSELVALQVVDLTFVREGVECLVRHSQNEARRAQVCSR